MAFRFNFQSEREDNSKIEILTSSNYEAKEVRYEESQQELGHSLQETIQLTPDLSLKKGIVNSRQASELLSSSDLSSSDLVTGKYEGGFKLWECAVDLAKHLCQLWKVRRAVEGSRLLCNSQGVSSKRALELGCGHGLPGILAAMMGMEVHFQDYNVEVLKGLTMPNYTSNLEGTGLSDYQSQGPRFFSGDWGSLSSLLSLSNLAGTYDYVFSTDSIYNLTSQGHLLDCIHQSLKPGGLAFIAAKAYYFGVGGSSEGFKKLASRREGFKVCTAVIIDDGSSNKREIFTIAKQAT